MRDLQEQWRARLRAQSMVQPVDAAAWALINLLPEHPIISATVASTVTGRSKSRVYEGIEQPVAAGVLDPSTHGQRNQSWEADELRDLIEHLEADRYPVRE